MCVHLVAFCAVFCMDIWKKDYNLNKNKLFKNLWIIISLKSSLDQILLLSIISKHFHCYFKIILKLYSFKHQEVLSHITLPVVTSKFVTEELPEHVDVSRLTFCAKGILLICFLLWITSQFLLEKMKYWIVLRYEIAPFEALKR